MRDPHVEELSYHIETGDELVFDNPPPLERETGEFRMKLVNGTVTFLMKKHYTSLESAKKVAEEYLENWEIDISLKCGSRQLRFIFDPSKKDHRL